MPTTNWATPTLIIGLGGTGKHILLRVKERLLEAYGDVPSEVKLFLLDTDYYGNTEYNGVRLVTRETKIPDRIKRQYREPLSEEIEFYHVATQQANQTIDNVIGMVGNVDWLDWLDKIAINKTLAVEADRIISKGAGTCRPVGKLAMYADYQGVYSEVLNRILAVTNKFKNTQDQALLAHDRDGRQLERRLKIYVISSVAGGSGAGMVVDVLRMLTEIIKKQLNTFPYEIIPMLVGGKVITKFNQRALANTYAALRELERLGAVPGEPLATAVPPHMVAPSPIGRTSSEFSPAEKIFLFDSTNRLGITSNRPNEERNLQLEDVVYPSIADLIMAISDDAISAQFDSISPDVKNRFGREFNGVTGYYPFWSAGIHTHIFPERDVRTSAGFELLSLIWTRYLVREKEDEERDPFAERLEPVTQDLWNDSNMVKKIGRISPLVFADEGFRRREVCKGVPQNRFVAEVVRASLRKDRRIELPPDDKFLGLFGGKTKVEQVLALIGAPGDVDPEQIQANADEINAYIENSLDELAGCENYSQVLNWKKLYLGSGPWGLEEFKRDQNYSIDSTWLGEMKALESINAHQKDFRRLLEWVIAAILNDRFDTRLLPYRYEYAQRVLDRLSIHVRSWYEPVDNQRSVLSEHFKNEHREVEDAREKLLKTEADAENNFRPFHRAVRQYASARSKMVASDLLEYLCKMLLVEVSKLQNTMESVRRKRREQLAKITERKNLHEHNRKLKSEIPVRTYVTDQGFEKQLRASYMEKGLDAYLSQEECSFLNNELYFWNAPFSKLLSEGYHRDNLGPQHLHNIATSETEFIQRAINWACTIHGNPDRQDEQGKPPFASMGIPGEVAMTDRISNYYGGAGHENQMVLKLSHSQNLASLMPLENWSLKRCMHWMALPRYSAAMGQDDSFYQTIYSQVAGFVGGYDERRPWVDQPSNPRHAVAFETAMGFRLGHLVLEYRKEYRDSYLADVRNGFALHCLGEERNASVKFENAFYHAQQHPLSLYMDGSSDSLYGDLPVTDIQLDHIVVDVLGNAVALNLFVEGLACGKIGQDETKTDFYLFAHSKRIRMSRMQTPDEIDEVIGQIASAGNQHVYIGNEKMLNRLRLIYALRSFILGLDENGRLKFDPQVVKQLNEQAQSSIDQDERVKIYEGLQNTFLNWFKECKDQSNETCIAHMGLVLARVAYDLKGALQKQQSSHGGEDWSVL